MGTETDRRLVGREVAWREGGGVKSTVWIGHVI